MTDREDRPASTNPSTGACSLWKPICFLPPALWSPPDGRPSVRENAMIRDGQMVCDVCQKPITRITEVPAEGWPNMHNLCSPCFAELKKQAVPRG